MSATFAIVFLCFAIPFSVVLGGGVAIALIDWLFRKLK